MIGDNMIGDNMIGDNMIARVELLAFGKEGEERTVTFPSGDILHASLVTFLERIFQYGQNEIQMRKHPSVSVGDVIVWCNRYLVLPVGFRELTDEEYRAYQALDRRERPFWCYELKANI